MSFNFENFERHIDEAIALNELTVEEAKLALKAVEDALKPFLVVSGETLPG